MDWEIVGGVIAVLVVVFFYLLLRWLVYICIDRLCDCCWIICCVSKKTRNGSESDQNEEYFEESPEFTTYSNQPSSSNFYNNNLYHQKSFYDPHDIQNQDLNQNWKYSSNPNPNNVQYQFNQKGLNRFQFNSTSPLNSYGQRSGGTMDPYRNQDVQHSPSGHHQNFSFNHQNYYNNYGQRSSNPNYQHQFYTSQLNTSRPSLGYNQPNQESVFVIPDQHSVNPIYNQKI